jgi:hypothetical protein
MTVKSISCALIAQAFPAETVDPGFTVTVVGTLADGSPFSDSKNTSALPFSYDFPAGTFQVIVSKLGAASQPSAPTTFDVPTTVSISVPDVAQAATIE